MLNGVGVGTTFATKHDVGIQAHNHFCDGGQSLKEKFVLSFQSFDRHFDLTFLPTNLLLYFLCVFQLAFVILQKTAFIFLCIFHFTNCLVNQFYFIFFHCVLLDSVLCRVVRFADQLRIHFKFLLCICYKFFSRNKLFRNFCQSSFNAIILFLLFLKSFLIFIIPF